MDRQKAIDAIHHVESRIEGLKSGLRVYDDNYRVLLHCTIDLLEVEAWLLSDCVGCDLRGD